MEPNLSDYHLLAKPAGAACNLGCQYCFFLSKENLYQGDSHLMDESTLDTYIRQLMDSSPGPQVDVAWQGGEPMLRGLDFYKRSVELAERYRKPHQQILHTIQTNGTLIDDAWARFFKQHNYLVGVSFDEWVRRDVGKIYVTTFDTALGSWLGQHNACIVSPTCGNALALEHNGDVYSCDHFVEPDHLLGNLKDTPLGGLVRSEKQRRFGQAKYDTLPRYCRECPVLFACYGECPRNRFIRTPDGEQGLNYLCAGYKGFFTHIDPAMKTMASLLRQGRYADEIMGLAGATA